MADVRTEQLIGWTSHRRAAHDPRVTCAVSTETLITRRFMELLRSGAEVASSHRQTVPEKKRDRRSACREWRTSWRVSVATSREFSHESDAVCHQEARRGSQNTIPHCDTVRAQAVFCLTGEMCTLKPSVISLDSKDWYKWYRFALDIAKNIYIYIYIE